MIRFQRYPHCSNVPSFPVPADVTWTHTQACPCFRLIHLQRLLWLSAQRNDAACAKGQKGKRGTQLKRQVPKNRSVSPAFSWLGQTGGFGSGLRDLTPAISEGPSAFH